MFFFFVGGVNQEVRRVVQSNVGQCMRCGSEAALVEYDNVLKLFFVPVWRWPAKYSAIHCDKCGFLMPNALLKDGERQNNGASLSTELRCWSCDRLLAQDFRYCPFCGSAL